MIDSDNWGAVIAQLRRRPFRESVRVSKLGPSHPREYGMRRSVGSRTGQSADYRFALSDGAGLHVRDCGTHWTAHLDKVDPSVSLLGHLWSDAPRALLGGVLIVAGGIGLALGLRGRR